MPGPTRPKRRSPWGTIVAEGLFPYDSKLQKRAAAILVVAALGTAVCVFGVGLIADVGFWLAFACAVLYFPLTYEPRHRGGIE